MSKFSNADRKLKNLSEKELFSFAAQNPDDAERIGYTDYSYWRSTFRTFMHRKVAVALLIVMLLLLLFTFIQPLLPGRRHRALQPGPQRGTLVRHK